MFEKLLSFTQDVSDLPDQPALNQAAALKAQFDAAPNEVREYLNKLIDALKSTQTGDSGAKNIGVTSISGLTGSDVQTILESLKEFVVAPSWTAATLINGFANFDGNGVGRYLKYRKVGSTVFIIGTIKRDGGTTTAPFTNIPAGLRPIHGTYGSSMAANGSSSLAVETVINENGDLYISSWSTSNSTYIHINMVYSVG